MGEVRLFDAVSGELLWQLADKAPGDPLGRVYSWWPKEQVVFDKTGNEALMVHGDLSIVGYDSKTGKPQRTYVSRSSITPRWFRTSGDDGLIVAQADESLVSIGGGTATRQIQTALRRTIGVVRSTRGEYFVQHDIENREIHLYGDLADGPKMRLPGLESRVSCVDISRDGRWLAVGGTDRSICIWDLDRLDLPIRCIGHECPCESICFSRDSETLISHALNGGTDGTVRFWHVQTGAELVRTGSRESPVLCMDVNPVDDTLAIGVERDGRFGLIVHRLDGNGHLSTK